MTENDLTDIIIREAIHIHRTIGPGLLEKIYVECLYYRLTKLGLYVVREMPIPVVFEEVRMDCGYRADLVVENKVIVEVKSIEAIAEIFISRTITYLKFSKCKVGLLINFNVTILKHGIRRLVNNF